MEREEVKKGVSVALRREKGKETHTHASQGSGVRAEDVTVSQTLVSPYAYDDKW